MIDRELIVSYVLGELEPDERAELELRLQSDPSLRAEVDEVQTMVSDLQLLPDEGWPPGVEGRVGQASESRPSSFLSPLRVGLAALGVAVVLAIGVAIGTTLSGGGGQVDQGSPQALLVPLLPGASGRAVVRMPAPEEMELKVTGLPPAGPNHYYEAWLMSSAARTVPLASFRVGASGSATVRVPLPADPEAFQYFDVSRQAVSAGPQHSAESVLRGPTRSS